MTRVHARSPCHSLPRPRDGLAPRSRRLVIAACGSSTNRSLPPTPRSLLVCAPGYYTADDTSVAGFKCRPCGRGYACPGAKVTAASSAARIPCGANKTTTTDFGKSDRECVARPGIGWGPGDTSAPCPVGFYNPGYNNRKCTKCPGSLTTLRDGSFSSQDCMAPKGHYYMRGKAVPCARGTYKDYTANNDCDECPEGITTPANTSAQIERTSCSGARGAARTAER